MGLPIMAEATASPKPKKKNKQELQQEEMFNTANEIVSMWMDFRKYVRMAFGTRPINRSEEEQFLNLKSNLARLLRILSQKLPQGFRWGSRGIHDLMGQAISMTTLRELPVADKKGIYTRWHECHISLEHMMGILDLMGEGHKVVFETVKSKTGNIKQDMGLAGDKKKKMITGKRIGMVLLLAAAAFAVYYLMSK